MPLVDLIQDHRYIVLVVTLPLLAIYGNVLIRALFASPTPSRSTNAGLRRSPPKPLITRPPVLPELGKQESLAPSTDQGVAGHQRAGAAKTVKLPVTTPRGPETPASARGDASPPASGSRIEVKTGPGHETTAIKLPTQEEAQPHPAPAGDTGRGPESKTGLLRKASRMEELGFHTGIQPDQAPSAPAATDAHKPTEIPRSQTAELTSILERIDKFLAEDQPAPSSEPAKPSEAASAPAPTPAPSQPAAASESPATKKTQPLWARADVLDEDVEHPPSAAPGKPVEKPADKPADKPANGDQQRLF